MPSVQGTTCLVNVAPAAVKGNGPPPASYRAELGIQYFDVTTSPPTGYTYNGSTWETGGNAQATETVAGIARIATAAEATTGTDDTTIMTPAKVALIAIAGAPDATEITKGIAELATQAETDAGTDDTRIVTPLKLANFIAAGGFPGVFTDLTATGTVTFTGATGGINMTSGTASDFGTTGAGIDLTLSSAAGRVIVNGEEAAANAITLLSAAGGIDVNAALQINIETTQNAVDAIRILASAGGIDIDAVGAATEDINITNTGGSIVLSATENAADSIQITSTAGGIDITAAGAATEDIDITNTAGSIRLTSGEAVSDSMVFASSGGIDADAAGQVNIASSQNAADAIVIISSAGGVDITATGTAGEDLDLLASGSSINLTATEDAAEAIYLRANGGTSETIRLHADQGTGVASINIGSDVGGITIAGGLGTGDAVNITASTAGGGIDIDASTGGFLVDTSGSISLDATAASNFTATGAFDLTIQSTAGSILINAGEAVSDAVNIDSTGGFDLDAALQINIDSAQAAVANSIRIVASAVDGGIDIDSGTGGLTLDSTGAISINGAAASNMAVSGAGIDLTLDSAAGQLILTGGEAVNNAVRIQADDAAGGIDIDSGTGGITIDSTGVLSLDSAGATNLTATGAFDITINSTAGSINLTAGESAADSMVFTNNGMDIVIAGAAGRDFDLTNTGGSVNITATESVSDAIVINASGAAGGVTIDAGTNGFTLGTGIRYPVTAVATAGGTYTILNTDYFITTDSTGGAFQVDLPATPVTGMQFVIYDGAGQAAIGGNITISGNGNNIAAGGSSAASKLINTAYESYILTWDGTLWCGQNIV